MEAKVCMSVILVSFYKKVQFNALKILYKPLFVIKGLTATAIKDELNSILKKGL